MAQQTNAIIIGIDVCKDRLDLFEHESGRAYAIGNDATSIETWLDRQGGRLQLAIEPTNRYHEAVAEAAHARGHEVYWIDPYRLTHYRAGLGRRAKTDPEDAWLLATGYWPASSPAKSASCGRGGRYRKASGGFGSCSSAAQPWCARRCSCANPSPTWTRFRMRSMRCFGTARG